MPLPACAGERGRPITDQEIRDFEPGARWSDSALILHRELQYLRAVGSMNKGKAHRRHPRRLSDRARREWIAKRRAKLDALQHPEKGEVRHG